MLEVYHQGSHHDDMFIHQLGAEKSKGWTVLNGHVESEWDFIWFARHILHNPYHGWDEINWGKKVLNVTAGFNSGTELDYGHIKSYFQRQNLDWEENLGLWNAGQMFGNTDDGYHLRNYFDFLKWMRSRPIDETARLQYEIHSHLADVRRKYPDMQMYELYISAGQNPLEGEMAFLDEHRRNHVGVTSGDHLQYLFAEMAAADDSFFETWRHCEDRFFEDSGIWESGTYHEFRNHLGAQILDSASIFFWGGQWNIMHDYLNFFRLKPFFEEAQRRGTNFYGMSAGVIVLSDRIYMGHDMGFPRGYQTPYGFGLGLCDNVNAYSHIIDMDWIRAEAWDVISSVALRHRPLPTIGLTRNSTALIHNDDIHSIGSDPVYFLDNRGFIQYMNMYDYLIRK